MSTGLYDVSTDKRSIKSTCEKVALNALVATAIMVVAVLSSLVE